MLPPFEQEVARFIRLLMYSLEYPSNDKNDLITLSSRLKRMRSGDPAFTSLARMTAGRVLRWAWFGDVSGNDEVNVMNYAHSLLKALEQRTVGQKT